MTSSVAEQSYRKQAIFGSVTQEVLVTAERPMTMMMMD